MIDPRSAIRSGELRGALAIGAGLVLIAAGYWAPSFFWRGIAFFTPLVWIAGATLAVAGLGVVAVAVRDRLRSNES